MLITFALELFSSEEIPIVLGECRRILVSGGRLSVVAMSGRGPENLVAKVYGWSHRAFPRVVDCRPIPVRETMAAAGFVVEACSSASMYGLAVEAVLGRRSIDNCAKFGGV